MGYSSRKDDKPTLDTAGGAAVAVVADLEGTLTVGETWRGLDRFLRAHERAADYRLFFVKRFPGALAARFNLIDRRKFRDAWLTELPQFFKGMSEREFAEVAAWVVENELWPRRRHDVIAALRVHQAAGEDLVLSSGTYQPVLESFARRLGARALGTPLAVENGALTGKLGGAVNVGKTKAERLHDALGVARLYAAYGDTEADVPTLLLSDRPVAVYPDKVLKTTATALEWTILD